eukprot:TRINITY_DN4709_c0_g2_i1.p1 TRINITY_DN4709_c0_g2~~TRINITY_DN4709_c0_g2_i1.p1  ORF type:complete len:198 (-),score=-0.41 TRINITY_DN4709_c0_g2_i1:202-795(-)
MQNTKKHLSYFIVFSQVRLTFSITGNTRETIQNEYCFWLNDSKWKTKEIHPKGKPPKKIILQVLRNRFHIFLQNLTILNDEKLPFEIKLLIPKIPSLFSLIVDVLLTGNFYDLVSTFKFQTLPLELRHLLMDLAIRRGLNGGLILFNYDSNREQELCKNPLDKNYSLHQMYHLKNEIQLCLQYPLIQYCADFTKRKI